MSVSRGTPAPPPAAVEFFGSHLDRVRRYVEWLASDGVERGLIGPREVDRIWDRHVLNCAVIESGIPLDSRVCDVGSGAGLPGIVISLVRLDISMVLLEPLLRRWTFLTEVLDGLELSDRVSAVRDRAEDHSGRYDVVVARAVAPLDRLAGVCLPLCGPSGTLLAMKGRRAGEELAAAEPMLRKLRARAWSVEVYGDGVVEPPTTAVRIEAEER